MWNHGKIYLYNGKDKVNPIKVEHQFLKFKCKTKLHFGKTIERNLND